MRETLRDEAQHTVNREAKSLSTAQRIFQAVEDLEIGDLQCACYIDQYRDDPIVIVHPYHEQGVAIFMEPDMERARDTEDPNVKMAPSVPNLRLVDTTPLLSQIAKLLLPKVGKFEKGFDEESNEVTLTTWYQGIKFVIKDDTPKTCTVEKIVEDVDIPEKLVPAHKEKRVRYRLVGDCDPIMADEAAYVVTSQGAIEVPPEAA